MGRSKDNGILFGILFGIIANIYINFYCIFYEDNILLLSYVSIINYYNIYLTFVLESQKKQ